MVVDKFCFTLAQHRVLSNSLQPSPIVEELAATFLELFETFKFSKKLDKWVSFVKSFSCPMAWRFVFSTCRGFTECGDEASLFFTAWRFVSCCSGVSSELGFDLKASSCLDAREFVVCSCSGCGFKEFGPDNSGNSVNNQWRSLKNLYWTTTKKTFFICGTTCLNLFMYLNFFLKKKKKDKENRNRLTKGATK